MALLGKQMVLTGTKVRILPIPPKHQVRILDSEQLVQNLSRKGSYMYTSKIFNHGGDHYVVFRDGDDHYIYDGSSFYKRVVYRDDMNRRCVKFCLVENKDHN